MQGRHGPSGDPIARGTGAAGPTPAGAGAAGAGGAGTGAVSTPSGWRRALVGLAVGAAVGVVLGLLLPHEDQRPER
jgi:hypothetical protein